MTSFKKLLSLFGAILFSVLVAAPVFAQSLPLPELDSSAPAPALSAGGTMLLDDAASKTDPAAVYAVDYVIFARNVLLIATVYLTMRYIGGVPSKKKKRTEAPNKSVGSLLFLSMLSLLATQLLAFWLFTQESGPPSRMHKTVPFGREYFVY